MQQLFAFRLEAQADDIDGLFAGVLSEVAEWAWRGDGETPDLVGSERGESLDGDRRISWDGLEPDSMDERARLVEFTHPDEAHAGLEWNSTLQIVRAESTVRITIRVSRGATDLRLAPATLQLGKPRIVNSLIQHFQCSAGDGMKCTTLAHELQPRDVEPFMRDVLTQPGRRLPVLVLSPAVGREAPETPPDNLARTLAGLAHVYVLSGHLAWERLKAELGEDRFVPRGGARIYWPGFGASGDSLHHRYWLRSDVAARRGTPFWRQVLGLLARLSVLRVPGDPLLADLRLAVGRERREAIAEAGAEEALKDFQEELDRADDLEAKLEEAVRGRDEARSELATAKANLEAMAAHASGPSLASSDDEAPAQDTEGEAAPLGWGDVAEFVEDLASEAFVLTERARGHLRDPSYPDAERMYEHLDKLANAAEAFAAAGGEVNQRFAEWIRSEHGLTVSLQDDQLERNKALASFEYDGQTYSRVAHVKVDDYVDPASCGRIYFALDTDNSPPRILVDHIGLHL